MEEKKQIGPMVRVDTPDGPFTARTSEAVLWWVRKHNARCWLVRYIYIQDGTDRRRIKRIKRRIRRYDIRCKIAQARGQL